ncbi:MAG: sulfatase [Chloroflexota bacterium]|nr:sulfatase [Chloroflexota bacterium]
MKLAISIIFILVVQSGAATAGLQTEADISEPPDILLILADDMTEADWRSLPRTQELLPTVFPNYINVLPLCCPSRASILRGQYPHSHGTLLNQNSPRGGWESFQKQEQETIAALLQDAGYHTGLIGKYFNGYPVDGGVPPGWDYWFAKRGHKFYDWQAVEGTVEANEVRSYGSAESDYSTDVITGKATAFVAEAPGDQPLFALVAPAAPHTPATPARRHKHLCATLPLGSEGKPSLNEEDVSDKPSSGQLERLAIAELTAFDRDRQCSLKAVDELVVAMITALELRDRPYTVIFATDNGFLLGEHRRVRKNAPYEESLRTSMRAVGPDFTPGEDERLIGNIDLAPTLAAIAGAPPRDDWDGRSFLGRASPRLVRELIGIESFGGPDENEQREKSDLLGADQLYPPFQGFRSKDGVVYVEYGGGEVELYDLQADPYQLENLAIGKALSDFPAYHARVERLRTCHAQGCWMAEDEPLGGE